MRLLAGKEERNQRRATVNWQFTTEKARDKFDTADDNIKNNRTALLALQLGHQPQSTK